MKNSLIFALMLCALNVLGQNCQQQLEALRKEGRELSASNNELKRINEKLRMAFSTSQEAKVLADRVRDLQKKLSVITNDRDYERSQIAEKRLKIKKLEKEGQTTTRDLQKLYVEVDSAGRRLARQEVKFRKLEMVVKQKQDSIRELKAELIVYKSLVDKLDKADEDRIYVDKKLVVFAGQGRSFNQTIFVAHFNWNDTVFVENRKPASVADQENVARFVKLVSKYSDRVKIHLVVGSRVNDRGYRVSREKDLRRYMQTFPNPGSPLNLSDSNFSKPDMLNTSSYDIQVQVVRK